MMTINENKNYFYRLLNGETSLWVVFWFWFIFITFLIEVFFEVIFMDSVYSQNRESYVELIIYIIITIYAIVIFLTIFRTANRYKGFKLWSFLSKVLVTINLFFSMNFFIEINKFYFYEEYDLDKEIESYKELLPIQVDMNATLIDIYKEKHTIYYKYQLSEVHLEDENLKNKFKKQIQDSLCADSNNLDLLKRDYILNNNYVNEKEEEIITIITDKKACGDSIYDLEILNQVLEKQGKI
jgi:hypothetical protein